MNQAQHAVRAAQNMRRWGVFAAARYCKRRGVPPEILLLAVRLGGAA